MNLTGLARNRTRSSNGTSRKTWRSNLCSLRRRLLFLQPDQLKFRGAGRPQSKCRKHDSMLPWYPLHERLSIEQRELKTAFVDLSVTFSVSARPENGSRLGPR